MPDYPNITTGLNKLSADVFNRVMDDLRSGENNWESLKGLIRETSGVASPMQTNPWQLCVIGNNWHLDSRDDFAEGVTPEYYGQRVYEWCSVSAYAMSLGYQHNYGGNVDTPGDDVHNQAGYQFNTETCGEGVAAGHPFISEDSEDWPNLFDEIADPDGIVGALHVWNSLNQPSSKKYYWRMADNENYKNISSGGAMNIAEASHSFASYKQAGIGSYIFPGLSWRNGCLADDITDSTLKVKALKRGTLVFMTLVPFYFKLGGTFPEDHPDYPGCQNLNPQGGVRYVNCFTAGPNISACCQPPEGAAAAASTGSIPFFNNADADKQTVTGDLYYDKDTKTLHTPNITTDGTSPSLGYSTDLDAVYIGNVHMGRGATTSTMTNPDPALFQPWVLTESVRTVEITVDGVNSLNLGSLNIAFYNSAYGRPTTKIDGTGATIVGNGTGTTVVSYDITLPAGAYWLGCCSNIGTVKIAGTSARDADASFIPRTTANLSGSFCIWKSSSDMTSLPESITATSELAPSDDTIPRIGLRYQGA